MLQYGIAPGASVVTAFDPNTFGTMLCGFDTFNPAKLLNPSAVAASNNDPLDQLTDISPNARHIRQTVSGKRPLLKTGILNGYPVIDFDGASQFFEMPSCTTITANKDGLGACFVHMQPDILSNYGIFEFEDGAAAHRIRLFSSNQLCLEGHRLDSDANDQVFSGGSKLFAAGVWYITIVRWTCSTAKIAAYVNSITSSYVKFDGTGDTTFSTNGGTNKTGTAASAENPVIGAASLYNSQLFKGQMQAGYFFEIAGFDWQGLMTALGAKLGISIS